MGIFLATSIAFKTVAYPKIDLLFGELGCETRATGRPKLRYHDVIKWDMKTIDMESWEVLAVNRTKWRGTLIKHLKSG